MMPDSKLQQAFQLHLNGQLNEAHNIYSELLNEDSQNPAVIYLIALVALEAGSFIEALNFAVHCIRLDETQYEYYFALAYAANALGWEDEVIQGYQKAVVHNNNAATAFSNLGHYFTEHNKYDDAIRCYRAAIIKEPKTAFAYTGLARTLNRMGLEKDACESLEIAIQLEAAIQQSAESTIDTLKRLDKASALLYKPPITLPGHSHESAATLTQKSKPSIRILHSLPGCGGALIAKCLGSMNNVAIFNDINPRSAMVPTYGQNIFRQADSWYGLFSDTQKQELAGKDISFAEGIGIVSEQLECRNEMALIKDWTYLDIFARPFIEPATEQFTLALLLQESFKVHAITVIRHPIEVWKSIQKLQLIEPALNLNAFLKGYRKFAEEAKASGFVRFEDFIENPDQSLIEICKILDFDYDSDYRLRKQFFTRIPSEPDEPSGELQPQKPTQLSDAELEAFESSLDYWPILKTLGYEHYQMPTQQA